MVMKSVYIFLELLDGPKLRGYGVQEQQKKVKQSQNVQDFVMSPEVQWGKNVYAEKSACLAHAEQMGRSFNAKTWR